MSWAPWLNNQVAVGSELRRGDLLTKINDRSCAEMTHREAVDLIKNAGSTISVVVKRYIRQSLPKIKKESFNNKTKTK